VHASGCTFFNKKTHALRAYVYTNTQKVAIMQIFFNILYMTFVKIFLINTDGVGILNFEFLKINYGDGF